MYSCNPRKENIREGTENRKEQYQQSNQELRRLHDEPWDAHFHPEVPLKVQQKTPCFEADPIHMRPDNDHCIYFTQDKTNIKER